jgi:methylmalonyl-CoA mutase
VPGEVIRATPEEKAYQIARLQALQTHRPDEAAAALAQLQTVAMHQGNLFAALMEAVKLCSLGQITRALFQVGGQYRRSM